MRRSACARSLSAELLEYRHLLAADIVINEIYYDSPAKTQFAEYIELYNNSGGEIDLSGWDLDDAVRYTFPVGTMMSAHSYLVIAQDPGTVKSAWNVDALGPWLGKLKNSGERIQLRDAVGQLVDEVDYKLGFPWPTVGDAPGHSIELIHPSLQNDVGGNWRRTQSGNSEHTDQPLVPLGSRWRHLEGTGPPSTPSTAWRELNFDDQNWTTRRLPVGYGDRHVTSNIAMRGNYTSFFLRKHFTVDTPSSVSGLVLRAQFDDGINVFINGQHVAGDNVGSRNASYRATANRAIENLNYVEFPIPDPADILVAGDNVIAVQVLNASLNGSSDAWFDGELLLGHTSAGHGTPGASNSVWAQNAPPATRRVSHGAGDVQSDEDVLITTKVTDPDGVASVTLQYQVVEPGDYFGRYLKARSDGTPRLNPRYDDPSEWTTVEMIDDGSSGDVVANDDLYSATIRGFEQQHRRLIRYRINVADSLGAEARVPYEDDPSPNFAYFVYDGVPDWAASNRPGVAPKTNYKLSEFNQIATYHLLTSQADHVDAQHIPDATTNGYGGSDYLWPGTIVYDGKVYDNISYRARGGVWRYAMGKNMWKFDFHRNDRFQAKDDYGNPYRETWDKLNFSAIVQQGNYLHRGEQGLFESVGFKLFNLAGVEAPLTHYVHFRVIDSTHETTADQFTGDFRGLYLAVEQMDGNFLEQHGLPDGNLYKIEGHVGDSNNQGPSQVSDGSDVESFISAYRNGNPNASWWRENFDLDRYYSYRTIVDAIHHYDIAYGKNYFYYHNPETERFQVHPWDLDLTWANNMFGDGNHDFRRDVYLNRAFRDEAENRARELLDLLFNDEQTGLLIDEFASMVSAPGELSWVDADRAKWDYNPIMRSSYVNPSKAGQGRFYDRAATGDFLGMAQLMKDYVVQRSAFITRQSRSEDDAPRTPTITYTGPADYPVNALSFQTSAFVDPKGDAFGALQWRIAEVTDPDNPTFGQPIKYEIDATYESDEFRVFEPNWRPPANRLTDGTLYRVRVRMKNHDGNWSHWSDPVQFTTSVAVPTDAAAALRIAELHYHPADPSPAEAAAGFTDQDDFEFVELINIGTHSISLANVAFQQLPVDGETVGLQYAFDSDLHLGPNERILVVEDIDAFRMRYGDDLPVAGEWSGGLNNRSEIIRLVANGTVVHQFTYRDAWHPSTDGDGYSMEVKDVAAVPAAWSLASNWQPSRVRGGTPGMGETSILGDFDVNGQVDADDIDMIASAIGNNALDSAFDLNDDGRVDSRDRDLLVEGILKTYTGDFDLDGEVGFSDFVLLSGGFGSTESSWSKGDANGDGRTDFLDFSILASNFGRQ